LSDKRPIGLLDSGLGGLTVVKEVIRQLPNEDIVFIGDEAHMPYGVRPANEIIKYTREMVGFLISQNVKAIIYGCNTATARALDVLQGEFDVPMIGVIKPGAQSAINYSKTKDVGIIGTKATVDSHSYPDTIHSMDQNVQVTAIAAQHFVDFVEAGTGDTQAAKDDIAKTLEPLKNGQIDTLILGCTHFPMLLAQIQEFMGPEVKLVDPGIEAVNQTAEFLASKNWLTDNTTKGRVDLYTSAQLDSFKKLATGWLGSDITQINLVNLGD
jgi:glutamate racemase